MLSATSYVYLSAELAYLILIKPHYSQHFNNAFIVVKPLFRSDTEHYSQDGLPSLSINMPQLHQPSFSPHLHTYAVLLALS